MLSLNANWIAALDQGQRVPIALVTIRVGDGAAFDHRWVSGDRNPDTFFVPNVTMGVASIDANAAALDPVSREVTVGDWSLVFVDEAGGGGRLRALISSTIIKGKKVTIEIGDLSLAEADFELAAENMMIDDFTVDGTRITLHLVDTSGWLLDDAVSSFRPPAHPLKVARTVLSDANVPTDVIDTAAFNEKADTTTSHFMITRHPWMPIGFPWVRGASDTTPQKAIDLLNSALSLRNASVHTTERGLISCKSYDRTVTAVRTFSTYDIADFEQLEPHLDIINDLRVRGHRGGATEDDQDWTYWRGQNATSIAAFAWPGFGVTERRFQANVPNTDKGPHPFLANFCKIFPANVGPTPLFTDSVTSLPIHLPLWFGFSGTKLEDASGNDLQAPSTTQQTEHTLNGTTRVAYIMITAHGNFEIVKATAFSYDTTRWYRTIDQVNYWDWGTYTIVRGQLGTTARDWTLPQQQTRNLYAYDVTLPVWLVEQRLDRFRNGAPRIAFTVPIRNLDIQLGDAIALSRSVYLAYGANGLDSSTVWEVIEKQPKWSGNNSGWRLTCSRIRTTASASPVEAVEAESDDIPVGEENSLEDYITDNSDVWVSSEAGEWVTRY